MEATWLVDFDGPAQSIELKNISRRQRPVGGQKYRPIMLASRRLGISGITAND